MLPILSTKNEQSNRCSGEKQKEKTDSLQKGSIARSKVNIINAEKTKLFFRCEPCDYNTTKKTNFSRHILTLRHKNEQKRAKKFECPICKKTYSDRSGLWRHKKKKCNKKTFNEGTRIKNNVNCLVKTLVDENKKILAQNQKLTETIQEMVPQMGNNTINNNQKISINVFLNENCKDAMNLTDFMKTLQVTLNDLSYAVKYGSVESISDIFIKRLTDMKPTERPIHCSDKKRLQFYVKDEDKWEKDKENTKIDDTIRIMNNKQMSKLHDWLKEHPNWSTNEDESAEYMKMVSKIAWPKDELQKNKDKVKRNISQVIELKDAMK